MSDMFAVFAPGVSTIDLDLSKWSVSKVIDYDGFDMDVEGRITLPNFN